MFGTSVFKFKGNIFSLTYGFQIVSNTCVNIKKTIFIILKSILWSSLIDRIVNTCSRVNL